MGPTVQFFACSFYFFFYLFIVFGVLNFAPMDLEIGQEVVVKTKKARKRKNTTSKVLKELLNCLCTNKHSHMLKWSDIDKKRFEVKLVNKQNKKIWKKEDISLFEHLDSLFETKVRKKTKYEEDAKGRFRSNMSKLKNYIKELPSRKESRSITYKTYEIFNMPKDVKLKIGELKSEAFKEEVKSHEVPIMENVESSNLEDIGGNQNNFSCEKYNEEIIPIMNNAESSNLGDIGGNQNNFTFEKRYEGIIPIMKNAESSNLEDIGGNQNNFSFEKYNEEIIPVMETGDSESSNLGTLGGNQNNFSYENNKGILNINIMGRNEEAMLGTFPDDLSNPVSTPALDLNNDLQILNNDLQTSQFNFDYISPNAYVGNFLFSKFEENVNNFKEKSVSRTLNKVSVTPFDTFGENSNIQKASEIFNDLNFYEQYLFSSDYEGNMKVGSIQIDDNFQLPVVEYESQSISDENRILKMKFFDENIQIGSDCEF